MFIAHIPSGYLLSTLVIKSLKNSQIKTTSICIAGIFGSVIPDFDLLYFYFIDHSQTHHHKYLSHWPLAWISLTFVSVTWLRLSKSNTYPILLFIFSLGGMLHLMLDSLVGDVWWFAPFINKPYALFTVHALYKPWWLNFILHWSFAIELMICAWALMTYPNPSK